MSGAPIFVVGVPRSGTTLLASLLSAHSRLACGPETAFFASLAAAGEDRVTGAGAWPEAGVAFLESSRLEGESLLERYGLDRGELAERLREVTPSAAALLAALGGAAAAEKERWVEKSPVHLLYVGEIRRHFPDSPIVRIVRDPRDVAMSLARVPWGPDDLTGGLLYWRRFHERSAGFFEEDRASFTVRYERLVAEPEAVLTELCDFLGESYEPGMLEASRSTVPLVRDSESWKGDAGGPVDPSKAARWRGLEPGERRLADALAGDLLGQFEYPLEGAALDNSWIWVHPRHEGAAHDPRLRRELAAGVRFWPKSPDEVPRAGLLVGEPDADDWLGRRSGERLATAAGIVLRVSGLRLRGKRVYWNRHPPAAAEARERSGPDAEGVGEVGEGDGAARRDPGRGWSSRLLSLALAPLTVDGGRDA